MWRCHQKNGMFLDFRTVTPVRATSDSNANNATLEAGPFVASCQSTFTFHAENVGALTNVSTCEPTPLLPSTATPMFCFPNSFGRRERGQLPSSPPSGVCPIASIESMTDDEPASPAPADVVNEASPSLRVGRWKKRLSAASKRNNLHVGETSTSCSSSSSSANNSRSNSCNREQTPASFTLLVNQSTEKPNQLSSQLSTDCSSSTASSSDNNGVWPESSSCSAQSSLRQGSVESPAGNCANGGDVLVPVSPTSSAVITPTINSPMSFSYGASPGARFKLVREGDVQVCYLNHTRTVVSKILSSKFLRRWETHRLYLNDSCISSKTPTGFLESSVKYSSIEEVYVVARWDVGHKFCIRIVVPDGSLLLQANNSYTRDQWFHSILWKKNIFKYRNILKPSSRPEVILKELKHLVDYATSSPLQDECVVNATIETVSTLLVDETAWESRASSEELISTLGPLLDNNTPSSEMCRFFSYHCTSYPRSPIVADILTPIIHRILKHNVDFSKSPHMRRFVQDYMQALYVQNAGEEVVRRFVTSVHGPSSGCPHPRVLPNLVSVCLAAVFSNFEDRRASDARNKTPSADLEMADGTIADIHEQRLNCHIAIFLSISEYDDWRPGLAQFLHPIPFPDEVLGYEPFIKSFMPVIESIAGDKRCDVHQMVLGIREGKEGWFHIYCPSSMVCTDDGRLWCIMVKTLLACCCRRKRFLSQLSKQLGTCLLLALRDHTEAQEALCLMLEWQLIELEDQKMQIVTTLQSTQTGRERYAALCERQMHLRELQQKGGPRKLTLPSRSTDADIARLLSCGSFGNLECLSLAFTHVTSACAEQIIKLPALRYLNLWATQFGDAGLLLISEHLPKLQVLNLCETPVSDKGIEALSSMTNLCKLNLNSTKLTATTFELLKKKLPGLQEFDVRYTEAW